MHACADVCAVYYVLRRHICRCAHGDLYGHACMCVADLTRSPGRPASAWVACAMPCAHYSSTGSLLPHANNTSSTAQTPAAAAAQPRRSVCLSPCVSPSMEGGSSRQGQSGTRERASQALLYQGMHAEHAVTRSMPNLLATAFLSHPAASYRLMDALLLCTIYIYDCVYGALQMDF